MGCRFIAALWHGTSTGPATDSGIDAVVHVATREPIRISQLGSTVIVRYYADAPIRAWHDQILRLLRTLADEQDIAVETDRIDEQHGPITDFPGTVRSSTPEAVYERDVKHNRALRTTIDRQPSKVFKTGRNFDIAGHVAVVTDTVQWASTLQGDAHGHGPGAADKTPIEFLEAIAESPSNRICIECTQLLDGDERYCPNCGSDLR